MRRFLIIGSVSLAFIVASDSTQMRTFHFSEPIDGLSIGIEGEKRIEVSGKLPNQWSAWESLEIEYENNPFSRETVPLLFSSPVFAVRVRTQMRSLELHPISISRRPISYLTAAIARTKRPGILSRAQWRADEQLLTRSTNGTIEPGITDVGEMGSASERAKECNGWQESFPEEFKTSRTVTQNLSGEKLRWPQRYSPQIKLLVVHHTALKVAGDERPPVERVRALYQYHADGLMWGDIGYHYVIDEEGTIYEGRAGGDSVVGGNVYCANVGTIGIALMGNFEVEKPTQIQMRSLKELLAYLADRYNLNLQEQAQFHGKRLPLVVGHNDLGKTRCPGHYLDEVMSQIRSHLSSGKLGSPITLPTFRFREDSTEARRTARLARQDSNEPILKAIGPMEITGSPGSQLTLRLQYIAGDALVPRRARLAEVQTSHRGIGVWLKSDGRENLVRNELISPQTLRPLQSQIIQLKVQLPREAKTYYLDIGHLRFTLRAEGRRVPLPQTMLDAKEQASLIEKTTARGEARSQNGSIGQSAIASSGKRIRIRLSYSGGSATIQTNTLLTVNGKPAGSRLIALRRGGDMCTAHVENPSLVPVPIPQHSALHTAQRDSAKDRNVGGASFFSTILRINPGSGISTITTWNRSANSFRGVIECRVIDGELVLINDLPLEEYLMGLAEEPDSEPYEKQRAFAIAARSYAAYYIHPFHRKFPNVPYDGDDSPARFQSYGGVAFEQQNPRWVQATKSTEGIIVSKNGEVVKTPYFTSDDGRTRSPEERGWANFPFEEVFESKPDPWCRGFPNSGHGVGMSGCGAEGQANEGRKAEDILKYYYEGTELKKLP